MSDGTTGTTEADDQGEVQPAIHVETEEVSEPSQEEDEQSTGDD